MTHFTDVINWEFANFTPVELACPCCGEIYGEDLEPVERLQFARETAGVSFKINSAHRCALYNASRRIGGAPLSQHKKWAFDISVRNRDRHAILRSCQRAGFTGFGFYKTFLHVDCGRARHWHGKGAKALWNG